MYAADKSRPMRLRPTLGWPLHPIFRPSTRLVRPACISQRGPAYGYLKVRQRTLSEQLTNAAMDALADKDVRHRLEDLGQVIPPRDRQTAEALGAYHKAEIDKWWPIIKAANIKTE
jgi:hypothetical protein